MKSPFIIKLDKQVDVLVFEINEFLITKTEVDWTLIDLLGALSKYRNKRMDDTLEEMKKNATKSSNSI